MNPQLIEAVARSSRQDAPGEARAARRAARLKAHPKLAAQLLRSIITAEDAADLERAEGRVRRAPSPASTVSGRGARRIGRARLAR